MNAWVSRALVFGSSAAVLVLEILAGRLLAPYVGVSLETFTGIIGTVLAGIALGARAGGVAADRHDARSLIGPALVVGGVLSWLSLPIINALGDQFGQGPPAIVTLSLSAFFLPAAVLSAVTPMVAKLRLSNLQETGAIVGGLSAAGTVGALAGTFLTGFVLVSALPTRPIVMLIGAVLVVSGGITHWYFQRRLPPIAAVLLVAAIGVGGSLTGQPCEFETGYFCANIVADEDNPSGRSLYLDGLRHAYVDLDDPTHLDIRYIRLFAQISHSLPVGAVEALHIGGGGFSFPRYLEADRPGSTSLVLEIDDDLVTIVEDELGLVQSAQLQVQVGDGRLAIDDLDTNRFHLVIGDAFASRSVPWHLTTTEFLQGVDRVTKPDGLYVMNVIDGGDSRFARAELATLRDVFAYVVAVHPAQGIPDDRAVNQVFIASQSPLPAFTIEADDGSLVTGDVLDTFIGSASVLRDDFAPVDQLLMH